MGLSKQCPSCGHSLQSKPDWLGLPAGVKFDPTDQELIEHLQAKLQHSNSSHPLIDDFITTIQGEDGICYTHPQNLPGVTRDGLSRHFFHRPSKAYTTGTRKRRKIQTECGGGGGEKRWHKTGKTRAVMAGGAQIGCKKILVLYTNSGKNRKPGKTNWVMHQYHLGHHEEEREGDLVVSKIFYQTQPRQSALQNRELIKADELQGGNIEETSTAREADGTCKVAHHHVAYYSTDQIDISSLTLPSLNQDFQEQQHHHTLGASSGLEELIMSCTSTSTKQETTIANPQGAEWSTYSTFWPNPIGNSDHHQ